MNQFVGGYKGMRFFSNGYSIPSSRKVSTWFLAFCWIFGFFIGTETASFAGPLTLSLMRTAIFCRVSIVSLVLISVLPFLLSAFAVFFNKSWLLLPLSLIKAVSFSFCSEGLNMIFDSSGWLIRSMLLFSDIFLMPLLCWFMFRLIKGGTDNWHKELGICLITALFVGLLNYCVVSSFLVTLMQTL